MRPKLSWDPFYVPADRGGDVGFLMTPSSFQPCWLPYLVCTFLLFRGIYRRDSAGSNGCWADVMASG